MMKGLDRFPTKKDAIRYIQKNVYGCAAVKQAEKYLREKIPHESHYQKKIMDALKKQFPDANVWKEAAGAYSQQGRPDVSAIISGKFFGFEIKRPYYGVITDMQQETINRIQKAGGYAGVVVFPEDAFRIIEDAGRIESYESSSEKKRTKRTKKKE